MFSNPDAGSGHRLIAFYLPQFHPIPENDECWGAGFTDWRNVAKAKPLFPGHYQPHVPADLGYYDLRVPEVRERQASLAREYGIYGFCYYHYWFNGKRLLERPFNEVLASGSPDLPFALCWANEEWTRNWDAESGRVLMAQHHSDADDLDHIRWLVMAFADDRYIKIDGRPLMLIYRAKRLPDSHRTTDLWRSEAQKVGFPDLYLAKVESHGDYDDPMAAGFDANVGFLPRQAYRLLDSHDGFRSHKVLDYDLAVEAEISAPARPYCRFPGVMCSWDNSPRRKQAAVVFSKSSPESYEKWLRHTVESVAAVRAEENFIFVVAWNEWAESNHLEPDERYGRGWLEATRKALGRADAPTGANADGASDPAGEPQHSFNYLYDYDPERVIGNVVSIARDIVDRDRLIVDLGAGGAVISHPLRDLGFSYHALEIDPVALAFLKESGIEATQCDLGDVGAVISVLDGLGDVGAILLLDVLEHLIEPQALLSRISAWARSHGCPYLLVSVPNVAHFDLGARLLLGRWDPTATGLLDSTHLRFFTEETLERMLGRCGWKVIDRNNCEALHSDQFAPELLAELPEFMLGALHVLSTNYNPKATVQQFAWALGPIEVVDPPESFLDAVIRPSAAALDLAGAAQGREALDAYMTSVGIFVGESHLRVGEANRHLLEEAVSLRRRLVRSEVIFAAGPEFREDPSCMSALIELADVYAHRTDLQRAFQSGEGIDAVGLLGWVEVAARDGDLDASRLKAYGTEFAKLRRAVSRQVYSVLPVAFDDLARTCGPEFAEAVDLLGEMYLTRPDLRAAFSVDGAVNYAALFRWAIVAGPHGDSQGFRLAPYSSVFAKALLRLEEPTTPPTGPPVHGPGFAGTVARRISTGRRWAAESVNDVRGGDFAGLARRARRVLGRTRTT